MKPVETQASILDFDLEESSDDSDFRIEDHPEVSDDDEDSEDGEGGSMIWIILWFHCDFVLLFVLVEFKAFLFFEFVELCEKFIFRGEQQRCGRRGRLGRFRI